MTMYRRRLQQVIAAAALMMFTGYATAQCSVDSIQRSGFDAANARLSIAGQLSGVNSATIELRRGVDVLATAQARDGTFEIGIPATVLPGAMLELRARGGATQGEQFIELASYLGTTAYLLDRSRSDGYVRVAEVPAVALTAATTATYALLKLAHPATPVANECELAQRTAALTITNVHQRAAVIKIIIDNDGQPSPTVERGMTQTTLDIVSDQTTFAGVSAAIEGATPGRIQAVAGILAEPFCSRFNAEAILVNRAAAEGLYLNNSNSAEVFQPGAANTGINVNYGGAESYQWQCAGEAIDVVYTGTRITIDYPTRVVNGVPQQVTAFRRTSTIRLTRTDSDAGYVTVADRGAGQLTFPYHPTLASESFVEESASIIVRERLAAGYTMASVAGSYLLPASGRTEDNAASAVFLDPTSGAVGAGLDIDAGTALSWTVNPASELVLAFGNRSVRIIPLRDDATTVSAVVALSSFNDGTRAIGYGFGLRGGTFGSWWNNEAAVQGAYLQSAGRVSGDSTFRIEMRAGNVAPSFNTYFAGEFAGLEFPGPIYHWSFDVMRKEVVLRRCIGSDGMGQPIERAIVNRDPAAGECDQYYRYRKLSLYTAVGSDLYVRELNRDWYSDPTLGDPPSYQHDRSIFYRYSVSSGTAAALFP